VNPLPVSLYFVWQWWEKHYQAAIGRPDVEDFDWLDATYIDRQKWLHEWFGDFGLGSASPVLELDFVSMILPYHTMIVPVVLGLETGIQEVGGYCWKNMSEQQMRSLVPTDIADTFVADLIYKERQKRIDRYGIGQGMLDLASVSNNGFTLRGPEFYIDLLAEPDFAQDYMHTITETMCLAYKFVSELFGPIEGFPIGNCNVVMMSPELYVDQVRDFDIRCVNYAAEFTGKPACCGLHHCNVPTEPFAQAYSAIPGLRSLQGSHLSDIPEIHSVLPDVKFSAMVNPVDLINKPEGQVRAEIEKCVANGASDLAIWDIDPVCGPKQISRLLGMISEISENYDRQVQFSVIPMSWEELDWEFQIYNRRD